MKFEDYLEQFCSNESFWKGTGEPYYIKLPLRIRLKQWLLERKGYIVRIKLEWYYHSIDPSKTVKGAHGYGYARVYKYKPKHKESSIDITEGEIN